MKCWLQLSDNDEAIEKITLKKKTYAQPMDAYWYFDNIVTKSRGIRFLRIEVQVGGGSRHELFPPAASPLQFFTSVFIEQCEACSPQLS